MSIAPLTRSGDHDRAEIVEEVEDRLELAFLEQPRMRWVAGVVEHDRRPRLAGARRLRQAEEGRPARPGAADRERAAGRGRADTGRLPQRPQAPRSTPSPGPRRTAGQDGGEALVAQEVASFASDRLGHPVAPHRLDRDAERPRLVPALVVAVVAAVEGERCRGPQLIDPAAALADDDARRLAQEDPAVAVRAWLAVGDLTVGELHPQVRRGAEVVAGDDDVATELCRGEAGIADLEPDVADEVAS